MEGTLDFDQLAVMRSAQHPRVLLYAHDGTGLGHLRRVSRVAAALQDSCDTMIMTGLKSAHYIVPETCELLRLPSWYRRRIDSSGHITKEPWPNGNIELARKIRSGLIQSAIDSFEPHAIVVDYLPFGQRGELASALRASRALKYLIIRGIIDTSDIGLLCGAASSEVAKTYHRILIAADRRVVDLEREHAFDPAAISKMFYTGYVAPSPVDRVEVRKTLDVPVDTVWVVCSQGGGMPLSDLMPVCVGTASMFPQVMFHVVIGPQALSDPIGNVRHPANCRVLRNCPSLSDLHSACDILVTSGGYNSMMEGATGGARLIVHPNQSGLDDEQIRHSHRLSSYYPIKFLSNLGELQDTLGQVLCHVRTEARPMMSLDVSGAVVIRSRILRDLQPS